jgi:hypothetical protein
MDPGTAPQKPARGTTMNDEKKKMGLTTLRLPLVIGLGVVLMFIVGFLALRSS